MYYIRSACKELQNVNQKLISDLSSVTLMLQLFLKVILQPMHSDCDQDQLASQQKQIQRNWLQISAQPTLFTRVFPDLLTPQSFPHGIIYTTNAYVTMDTFQSFISRFLIIFAFICDVYGCLMTLKHFTAICSYYNIRLDPS